MFCSECGKEVKDSKYCPYCGKKIEDIEAVRTKETQTQVLESESDERKKRKGTSSYGKITIGFICVAVLVLAGCLFLGKSKSEKFLEMLKQGDTEQAAVFYQSNLVNNEKQLQEVYETVTEEIDSIVTAYYSDNMSYDDAKNGLSIYSDFYNSETGRALEKVEQLKISQDAFLQAEQAYSAEDYKGAYGYYAEVINEDSNFAIAQEKKEESYAIICKKMFSESERALEEKDYVSAISIIQNELDFLTEEDKLVANEKIDNYITTYLSEARTEFDLAMEKKQFEECFAMITDMRNVAGNMNEKVLEIEGDLHKSFENYIQENFEASLKELDLANSEVWIQEGINLLPDSILFSELEVKLQAYYPVELFEIEPFQKSTYFNGKAQPGIDNQGNEHELAYGCGAFYIKHADWKLDKKYNRLTGMVGVPSGNHDTGVNGKIILYGDGNVIWEKQGIDASTAPEYIEIDVTNVDVLKVRMEGGSKSLRNCDVMVADFVVQKTKE